MQQPLAKQNASDAVRSRPDEGVHHANAGASQADRGNCSEGATRLTFSLGCEMRKIEAATPGSAAHSQKICTLLPRPFARFSRLLAAPLRLFRRFDLSGHFRLSACYRCAASAQSHFFGQIRTRSGIARSNHRIIMRQTPLLPVLFP